MSFIYFSSVTDHFSNKKSSNVETHFYIQFYISVYCNYDFVIFRRFQHQAFIQKKLAERSRADRAKKKSNGNSARLVVSRSHQDKMVEERTELIASSQTVRRTLQLDEEPMEEWFQEEDEDDRS